MPLNDLEKVRSLVGDMEKAAVNEAVATCDGATTIFQLDMFPVRTGSITVFRTGIAVTAITNLVRGTVDLTGSATPTGDRIVATYAYNALSDQEIQFFIDLASAASALLAASFAARAIAGNYAKFFAYTQGDKSVNKDKLSDKLLALAESLEDAAGSQMAGFGFSTTTFGESGTAFEGYDTASSNIPPTDWYFYR